jgi:UDP-2,4-diacetamido-2,4,6-trideoxy-beta-L-altropyranose hydrolase
LNFVFRTDASLEMGTGHVMRCLTLANALRDRGAHCRFICREHSGHLLERIHQAEFEAIALPLSDQSDRPHLPSDEPVLAHAHWLGTDWQRDAAQTIAAMGDYRPDWLIIDHYALDHRWESQLRPHCDKIMVIDDLADRGHDCDLLLDQNLVANWEHRYDSNIPTHCARLLGPSYALLQPQYAALHPRTPPRLGPIERILVYFGGADNQNLTGRAIAAFLALERADIALDVVINPVSPQASAVRQQVQGHDNITLYEGLPSLAPLIVQADLAIGAGGATSWERCCLGLPTLVVTLAENQRPIAAELDRQSLVRWLGDQQSVTVPSLKAALLDVFLDEKHLAQWSSRCRSLVDGRGTEQVATLLLLNSATSLTARPACLTDETLILQWANDPLVRQNAFHPEPIDEATHRAWFYKRLRNPDNYQIYILETEMGTPIGQVRFERNGEAWEIHYGLAAVARGRGLGVALLQTALQAWRQSQEGALVFGRVKIDNLPSKKVFEHLGFTSVPGRGGEVVYRCLF